MKQQTTKPNRNKLNLLVDCAIFVAFLVGMAPHFSGIAVHEWLGIAFGAAIITHLLLHWNWIVEVTLRFFRQTQWSARVNYMLNVLLFIAMTTVIFTGLLISEQALPALGIHLEQSFAWRGLHTLSANSVVVLVGLHIALHWNWLVGMFRRLLRLPAKPATLNIQPQEGAL